MTAKPYIKTGETRSKAVNINLGALTLEEVTTFKTLKYLAVRHKFGLVSTYAIVITITLIFPFVWGL